ncbi:copper chaperone PCu(A)C [Brevundimonas sp. Root1279]|uniref:copper chaperone PCu(A)C n=1 Tax=Brevundimonas sp. Root1279 TaxID=1736443 RepID=UPI0006FC1F63|nr:copper chaperone PCu(A)C [Brevundimonas sp. Root1279]KQW83187.1 hypothetical protein ASC65_07630 [Brevundimonas sp. Root1279]
MKTLPLLASAFVLAGLAACNQGGAKSAGGAEAATVQVTGALCRPTPPGRKVTGCYLTMTASTNDRLVSLSSEAAGRAQLHESKMENNMMVMYELREGLALPAGEAVVLEPNNRHIMLLGVKEPLKAGDTVPLTLTFASAPPVQIEASVAQPPVPGTEHAGH